MTLFFITHVVIAFGYLILIGWITTSWEHYEEPLIPSDYRPKNKFSIIIPFKDEGDSISNCIESLYNLDNASPEFEIIGINDHSSDKSRELAVKKGIHIIDSIGVGKKAALNQGIIQAKHSWIITIDADVIVHSKWLQLIDQQIQNTNSDVVVGPVKLKDDKTLLTRFQIMDFAASMGITLAGLDSKLFYLANGANFIFKKDFFNLVNGYEGNEKIASGDDVFLLNKFSKLPGINISFLKSERGAVISKSESTVSDFIKQRKRWATKTKAYANWRLILVQGYVFCLSFLALLDMTILPYFTEMFSVFMGIFLLFIKFTIDYLFLKKLLIFFKEKSALKGFFFTNLAYIFYILAVGIFALFPSKVDWKGRKV